MPLPCLRRFQSTRPVRGATTRRQQVRMAALVSIHAPRAGRDRSPGGERGQKRKFQSTRPVRGATFGYVSESSASRFQSTRPVRGATAPIWANSRLMCFNPRAPCGARPTLEIYPSAICMFQSTRPVRGATTSRTIGTVSDEFQSTRPVRGATDALRRHLQAGDVSIHAPRAGRDQTARLQRAKTGGFNPRAPCGARPRRSSPMRDWTSFQSTRPVRGATSKR